MKTVIKFLVTGVLCPIHVLLLFAQPGDLQFKHLTVEDGLANNCVISIVQDNLGFMWFGTSDGLNRYDGYTFKSFTHDAGDTNSISDNFICTLFQDTTGLLWVGTNDGLNTYDPLREKFTVYRTVAGDSASISNNSVNSIFEDRAGNIWIGTEQGLNRYNHYSDTFTRYYFPGQLDSVSFWWNNNTIRAINQDESGRLLLGTTNDFLVFDPQTGATTTIPYMIPGKKRWPSVSEIYKDSRGKFWIGIADDGLVEYDPETGESRLYQTEANNPSSFNSEFSDTICEDSKGRLWIGTADQGITIFNRTTGRFRHYKPEGKDAYSFKGRYVWSIYEDKQGNVWIGTIEDGINLMPQWQKPFRQYVHDPQNPGSLAAGEVTNFYQDEEGVLWVAHFLGGISLLNPNSGNFTHIVHDEQNPASLSGGALSGIYEDDEDYLWMASTPYLDRLNRKTGTFKHYCYDLSNPKSHAYTITQCCYNDRRGTLWFGTSNAGLERFNRADETFDRFCYHPDDATSISSNCIDALYQDRLDNFWIGTDQGLCRLVYDTSGREKFIRYNHDPANPASISGQEIFSICEDWSGRLWFGTDGGLNLFDYDKQTFHSVTVKDGLPSNAVMGVLEDNQGLSEGKAGSLWLRTLRGIVKYNPATGNLRVFDERDGLIYCKSILEGSAAFYKGKNGEIYSGSDKGVTVFHPDSLRDNPSAPKIVLTDMKINYQGLNIGLDSPLKKSITLTDTIILFYDQNILSFAFAALDYTAPEKNQYAYQLEGLNRDWVYCGNQTSATFTNLDPGSYIFRVKGSNNDGLWNEQGISLCIMIAPPWWQTKIAYLLYAMLITAMAYGGWRFQLRRERERQRLKMERFEAAKLKELDGMKSRFYANISHEFRTPLTLILGPVQQMLSDAFKGSLKEQYKLIIRNGERLLTLINQLLDLSKLESGKLKLQARPVDIVSLTKSLVQAFESLAKIKHIALKFNAGLELQDVYLDSDKYEKIINNLLSNAFKFTPEGGEVMVTVSLRGSDLSGPKQSRSNDKDEIATSSGELGRTRNDKNLQISITNTGPGIAPDKIDHIFDRFYQVGDAYARDGQGTGIGLALTKELVELHHGTIQVECRDAGPRALTIFTLQLPLGREHLTDNEIIVKMETADRKPETGMQIPVNSIKDIKATVDRPAVSGLRSALILIVEDNEDLRRYIGSALQAEFRLIEAENGKEGWNIALQKLPDMIISDVMMPEMDGFELCAKLKTDPRTCHIPLILLTARAAEEDKIGGLQIGADDYMIKPFNARELQLKVKNIIERRIKLQEKFRCEALLQPKDIAATSLDEQLLKRAMDIIEREIANTGLDVDLFVREMGISRAHLYCKIKALSGMSIKEFIRTVRLKLGAQLIEQRAGSVTEIAYNVGFSNPAYFAECFRKQFGLSPTQYASGKSN
jgi:signal transduction histidine kinase/ligand-binding sensor domain-containing protein/DNA-binding response OmpR family regulator